MYMKQNFDLQRLGELGERCFGMVTDHDTLLLVQIHPHAVRHIFWKCVDGNERVHRIQILAELGEHRVGIRGDVTEQRENLHIRYGHADHLTSGGRR